MNQRQENMNMPDMSGARKMDIDVVFFDVGNTLFRVHPSMEEVCREVIQSFGYDASFEDIRRGLEAADKYYEYRYWTDDSFWANEEDASRMWSEMYALMLEVIGVDGDRQKMGRALYDTFGAGYRWRTFPDVVPVFETLRRRGYRLGLISNWDSRLANLCFDMGLDRYLESVVSSASVGLIKPDPRIFSIACERLKVKPERALHVGDHYYADVLGARSAGLHPVLIDRFDRNPHADVPVIHDLYELLPILGIERAG